MRLVLDTNIYIYAFATTRKPSCRAVINLLANSPLFLSAIEKESSKLLAYLKTEIPASAGMTVKEGRRHQNVLSHIKRHLWAGRKELSAQKMISCNL